MNLMKRILKGRVQVFWKRRDKLINLIKWRHLKPVCARRNGSSMYFLWKIKGLVNSYSAQTQWGLLINLSAIPRLFSANKYNYYVSALKATVKWLKFRNKWERCLQEQNGDEWLFVPMGLIKYWPLIVWVIRCIVKMLANDCLGP